MSDQGITSADLMGRLQALEMAFVLSELSSAATDASFDARAFAAQREEAWRKIGEAFGEEIQPDEVGKARTATFARMGNMLVVMAETVAADLEKRRADQASASSTPSS